MGIDAVHGLHKPNKPHINGVDPFRSTTYGDGTMVTEPDLGLRPWLLASCARTGIFIATGSGSARSMTMITSSVFRFSGKF